MGRRLKYLIFIISFILVHQNKGGAMGEKVNYKTMMEDKLKQVNILDGVSKEEAIIIAQNYLLKENIKIEELGFLSPKVRESKIIKGCWAVVFDAKFKVRMESGLHWFRVHIDRNTGEIKSRGWGPS